MRLPCVCEVPGGENAVTGMTLNVERARIPPLSAQKPLVLTRLPLPHAGRPCGDQMPGRSWSEVFCKAVRARRAHRVRGPVVVTLSFDERRVRQNFAALAPQAIELIAALGLIDAGRQTVRQLILCWGSADGLDVRVEPVAGAGAWTRLGGAA
jgi:hypothetical protein